MTARIIKFPWRNFPVTVPAGHEPASIIILPVVRVERSPDTDSAAMLAAARLQKARERRLLKRKKLPAAFLSLVTA